MARKPNDVYEAAAASSIEPVKTALAPIAYATRTGLIGAGLVGLVAGAASYGLLIFVLAASAAVTGYALVHGVTGEAVPSEVWP